MDIIVYLFAMKDCQIGCCLSLSPSLPLSPPVYFFFAAICRIKKGAHRSIPTESEIHSEHVFFLAGLQSPTVRPESQALRNE